ncbi:MAG: c-type cytochrome [Planctomycetota bacterium]|nr:c-type cytochrome [Planctomycetota bacterium]
MPHPSTRAACLLLLACATASAQNGDKPGEEQPALDRSWDVPTAPVLSPEEALDTFALPPGYRIELAAGDALLDDPVDISFDAAGRLWAVEMTGLMPDADGTGELDPVGTIAVLSDTDGDGAYDERSTFADGLVLPRGLTPAYGGIVAILPPRLVWMADRDGDGRADLVETIDEGGAFEAGLTNPEHAPNRPRLGLDNWLYLINHGFRYRLTGDGWTRQPVPRRGQWGQGMDDWGRFVFDYNSTPLHGDRVPPHYLVRNGALGLANGSNARLVDDPSVRPSRINPGVNRGYQRGTLDADGYLINYTAACGPEVFRGTLLADVDRGASFVCEPSANLLRRNLMSESDGRVRGVPDPGPLDFLTSTDERFRPVNLTNGPDGALYVVDLYRGILQHRVFMTSFLRRQVEERGLDQPIGLGRIWRIVHTGDGDQPGQADPAAHLADLGDLELVAELGSPNGWRRDTAQQLLIQRAAARSARGEGQALDAHRSAEATLEALLELARTGSPLARLHALWTLEGLGQLTPARLAGYLSNETDGRLLANLVRLSESFEDDATLGAWARLTARAEPQVLWQLAHSLGERGVPEHEVFDGPAIFADPLALAPQLLAGRESDPILRQGLLSGLAGRELDLFTWLDPNAVAWDLDSPAFDFPKTTQEIGRCIARRGDHAELTRLLELAALPAFPDAAGAVARSAGDRSYPAPLATANPLFPFPGDELARPAGLQLLRGFVQGIKQRAPGPFREPAPEALARLLEAPDAELQGLATTLLQRLTFDARDPSERDAEALALAAAIERGAAVYATTCAACHQPDGRGIEGLAPPLGDPAWLGGTDAELAQLVIGGLSGPIEVEGQAWDLVMPPWGHLSDDEIADVLTYVLDEFASDRRRLIQAEAVRAAR